MQFLGEFTGPWTGSNSFRLMPTNEPHVAHARADISVAAGGNLAVIAYTWSHPEAGEQEGLLVVGPDEEPGTAAALWGDSWHQTPAAKVLTGVIENRVLSAGYRYAGDWEWMITVDAREADKLRLRMDNVVPQSAAADGHAPGAYWAMATELQRGE